MPPIIFESSERSDRRNWVKKAILNSNLDLLSFEGYAVKNSKVSLLLDRGLFEVDCGNVNERELFETLLSLEHFKLQAKVAFAKKLDAPFYFFCYSYKNENCSLYEITEKEMTHEISFDSWKNFGEWTLKFRDLKMNSAYQEGELPRIDVELRKLKIPWVGNLDYALLKEQIPVALIEFQNTTKATVEAHCNNTWFMPVGGRKGDVNRWLAVDIIRKQSNLPLYIIVWSSKEEVLKLKLVDKIVYPSDSEPKKGLRYKAKQVMNADGMLEIFNRDL